MSPIDSSSVLVLKTKQNKEQNKTKYSSMVSMGSLCLPVLGKVIWNSTQKTDLREVPLWLF